MYARFRFRLWRSGVVGAGIARCHRRLSGPSSSAHCGAGATYRASWTRRYNTSTACAGGAQAARYKAATVVESFDIFVGGAFARQGARVVTVIVVLIFLSQIIGERSLHRLLFKRPNITRIPNLLIHLVAVHRFTPRAPRRPTLTSVNCKPKANRRPSGRNQPERLYLPSPLRSHDVSCQIPVELGLVAASLFILSI